MTYDPIQYTVETLRYVEELIGQDKRVTSAQITLEEYLANKHKCDELIPLVAKLRELLSQDGDFAISRKDREPLGIGDIMYIGDLMKRIDAIIDETGD